MAQTDMIDSTPQLCGKYLTFILAKEQYALKIEKVLEIFGVINITSVPRCPDYLKGAINLRGKIIPIVDLRLKFNLPEKSYDSDTCIVVVNVMLEDEASAVGVVVDSVVEVLDFDPKDIASAPDYGSSLKACFIEAMGKQQDGQVSILIDIDRVFEEEQGLLSKVIV